MKKIEKAVKALLVICKLHSSISNTPIIDEEFVVNACAESLIKNKLVNKNEDITDVILDLLDISKDTMTDGHTEIINRTGIWPEDAFCRDWFSERIYDYAIGDISLNQCYTELNTFAQEQKKLIKESNKILKASEETK